MAYHEHDPWREPQRTKPTSGRIIFGGLLALAVITGLVLVIGSRLSRRHR